MESCLILKIDSRELPNDTKVSYENGKISLHDSMDNRVDFEANELIILHSKTIVVNSCAYIITSLNIEHLRGRKYYVEDNTLKFSLLPDDNDYNNSDNNDNDSNDSDSINSYSGDDGEFDEY